MANLGKWLVLILVVWLVYALWRRSLASGRRAGPAAPTGEAMVACSHCGLYVPAGEVHLGHDGLPYCCAQHGRLGPRR
ncbi:PP0621 family protein [Denitratisoma oestradiolicum]|uniref:Uncharacterized protein n=1 Tax=Denitratisoma oestradiolicum TaxID=311182 RepID=A0A6S6YCL3_9PROT|nr:PP0621 family protein [Denitratisoma oestradiolicum]CAB1370406.1 conserved protein of unknown function [Denitratisoma oestradiolicum]